MEGSVPIVTLDKIYIEPDEINIFFLDCTRVSGSNEIISRKKQSLDWQISNISNRLISKEIILADDVVFSGSVLRNIISRFKRNGIEVVGIISSICTVQAYEYFNSNLRNGIRCNYVLGESVIDQICERDFYFGIAGSGIMVNVNNNLYKAPYFKPFGEPCERASIPFEYEKYFSAGCLERSLFMWKEIDRLRNDETKIYQLPEKIINTNKQDGVVLTLKKEMRKL